jgi:hypothetical protein
MVSLIFSKLKKTLTCPISFPTISLCILLFFSSTLPAQEECMECHGETDLTKLDAQDREISLFVDQAKYANSIHGDFDCASCHVDAEEIPHEETLQKVDCGMCHDEALEAYNLSVHGKAKENGAEEAASCVNCHGKHDIVSSADPKSRVHPLAVATTCAVCHSDPKIAQKYQIHISDPLAAYKNSVHGTAVLSEENFDAATCVSCHGMHAIRSMEDPESPIYWKNVSETCGGCHGEEYDQYSESVHGTAIERGVREAPVCTDCHGEHEVKSPQDPKSPVHPLRVSAVTCQRCHDSELINRRFGMAEDRIASFEDSYHGLAIKGGSVAAANCASCHGIHNILPSSDPRSTVHSANLQKTCGSCHKDATENFARGPVHITTSTTPGRVVSMVRRLYIGLIIVVIFAMLVHNGADFVRRSKNILRQRDGR